MELNEFVAKIEEQYSEITPGSFNSETKFKEQDEWGSLTALMIIAMVDQEFNKSLNGDILDKCITIKDLYTSLT